MGKSIDYVVKFRADTDEAINSIRNLGNSLNQAMSKGTGNKALTDALTKINKLTNDLESNLNKPINNQSAFTKMKTEAADVVTELGRILKTLQDVAASGDMGAIELFDKESAKNLDQMRQAADAYLKAIKAVNPEQTKLTQAQKEQEKAQKDLAKAQEKTLKAKTEQTKWNKELKEFNQLLEKRNLLLDRQQNKKLTSAQQKALVDTEVALQQKANEAGYGTIEGAAKNQLGKKVGPATENYKNAKEELDSLTTIAKNAEKELNKVNLAFQNAQNKIELEAWDKLSKTFAQFGIDISQIDPSKFEEAFSKIDEKQAEAAKRAASEMKNLTDATNQTTEATKKCNKELDKNGEELEQISKSNSMIDSLKARASQIIGLAGAYNILRRSLRDAFNTVKELDDIMTEMAVVTNFTVGDMWDQLDKYATRARELGLTIQDVYEASTLYYQQGLTTNQVTALTTQTLKMARIAGLEAADATDRMTAALRGFNMELNDTNATNVADVYSKLAAITASNVDEISTAMTKVASLANSANMSFENTAAFLSQIIETTRESAETAGTALKTVVARFAEVKENINATTDSEGEDLSYNKIDAALKSVGLSLDAFMKGQEGLDAVLMRLAEKWDTLDVTTQRYIATQAAGSRQQSRFIALMSDYKRTIELTSAAQNAAGASAAQYAKTEESLTTKLNQFKVAWNQFTMGILESDTIKTMLSFATKLLEGINKLNSSLDGVGGSVLRVIEIFTALGIGETIINKLTKAFYKLFTGKVPKELENYNTLLSKVFGKDSAKNLTTFATKLSTVTGAEVAQGAAAAGATPPTLTWGAAMKAVLKQLVLLLPYIAAIGVAIWAFVGATKAAIGLSLSGRLKSLNNQLKELNVQLDSISNELSDITDQFDNLRSTEQELDNLVEGSDAWNKKLLEINENVNSLLASYPELLQFYSVINGRATINEEGQAKLLEKIRNKKVDTQRAVYTNQIATNALQDEVSAKQASQSVASALKISRAQALEITSAIGASQTMLDKTDLAGLKKILGEGNEAYAEKILENPQLISALNNFQLSLQKNTSATDALTYAYMAANDNGTTSKEVALEGYINALGTKYAKDLEASTDYAADYKIKYKQYAGDNGETINALTTSDYQDIINTIYGEAAGNYKLEDSVWQDYLKLTTINEDGETTTKQVAIKDIWKEYNIAKARFEGEKAAEQKRSEANRKIQNIADETGLKYESIAAMFTDTTMGKPLSVGGIGLGNALDGAIRPILEREFGSEAVQAAIDNALLDIQKRNKEFTGKSYNERTAEKSKTLLESNNFTQDDIANYQQTIASTNTTAYKNNLGLVNDTIVAVNDLKKAYSGLSKSYTDNIDKLKTYNKTTLTYQNALSQMASDLSSTFGVTVDSKFIEDNLALIENAIKGGDFKSFITLQQKAIAANIDDLIVGLNQEQSQVIGQYLGSLVNGYAQEAGKVIKDTALIQYLNALIADPESTLDIESLADAFKDLGYSLDIVNGKIQLTTLGNTVAQAEFNAQVQATIDYKRDEYEILKNIEQVQAKLNLLQSQYNKLVANGTANTSNLIANLEKQYDQQVQLGAYYKTLTANKKSDLQSFLSANADQGFGFNFTTGAVTIKAEVDDSLRSTFETLVSDYQSALQGQNAAAEAQAEIRKQGRDSYFSLIDEVASMLQESDQKKIDLLQEQLDAEKDATNKLINSIQNNFTQLRKDRQNEQTENDINTLTRRIAYLRQDTSGSNTLQIKQLEKELANLTQDYSDTLIDDSLTKLSESQDQAYEQRQQQIDNQNSMVAWMVEYGKYNEEATSIVQTSISDLRDGMDIANTAFGKLVSSTSSALTQEQLSNKLSSAASTFASAAMKNYSSLASKVGTTLSEKWPVLSTNPLQTYQTNKPTTTVTNTDSKLKQLVKEYYESYGDGYKKMSGTEKFSLKQDFYTDARDNNYTDAQAETAWQAFQDWALWEDDTAYQNLDKTLGLMTAKLTNIAASTTELNETIKLTLKGGSTSYLKQLVASFLDSYTYDDATGVFTDATGKSYDADSLKQLYTNFASNLKVTSAQSDAGWEAFYWAKVNRNMSRYQDLDSKLGLSAGKESLTISSTPIEDKVATLTATLQNSGASTAEINSDIKYFKDDVNDFFNDAKTKALDFENLIVATADIMAENSTLTSEQLQVTLANLVKEMLAKDEDAQKTLSANLSEIQTTLDVLNGNKTKVTVDNTGDDGNYESPTTISGFSDKYPDVKIAPLPNTGADDTSDVKIATNPTTGKEVTNGDRVLIETKNDNGDTRYLWVDKFAKGGLNKRTGPAWLDGTASNPELVLNAQDTQNFLQLRDTLRDWQKAGGINSSNGTYAFDVNINVDELANDYDVDQLAARVEKNITSAMNYRNNTRASRAK